MKDVRVLLEGKTDKDLKDLATLINKGVEILLEQEALTDKKKKLGDRVKDSYGISVKDFNTITKYIYTTQIEEDLEYLNGASEVISIIQGVSKRGNEG